MSTDIATEVNAILIVDDESRIAELIDITLAEDAYKTRRVFNGSEMVF